MFFHRLKMLLATVSTSKLKIILIQSKKGSGPKYVDAPASRTYLYIEFTDGSN